MIPFYPGVAPLAARYDGFILDLWGVIHDGLTAYPGAADALGQLKAQGKRIVLLSNAPRRRSVLEQGMAEMGIPRALYDEVISSGEATWQALVDRDTETLGVLGPRCCHMGPPRDRGMLDGIPYERTDDVAAADFILATGLDWDEDNLDPYEALLETAAARGLPLICANPDLVVIRGGKRVLCAGAIAERYEALGGKVVYIGKPYPAIYRLCLARLCMTAHGIKDHARVVAIGDALRTDIAGAEAAGIDGVLVTGGVHAEELGIAHGDHPDMAQVERVCRQAGVIPTAAIPAFRW